MEKSSRVARFSQRHRHCDTVTPDKYDVWLDPDVTDFDAIRDSLKPYDVAQMRRYPVSTKLNNSQNEGAESATPVTLDTPIQARLF